MSVSFGTFRKAVREPQFRTQPGLSTSGPHTPSSTFRKAIRVYHREGRDRQAAEAALSLSSPYWRRPGRGRTLANNYRDGLRRYFDLDAADGRLAFDFGASPTVELGIYDLRLYIDALVYNLFGHGARICLWDKSLPTEQQATIMAAPVALGLQQMVGEDRAREVAFWHLRSGKVFPVAVRDALAELQAAQEALARAAGAA